MHSCYKKPTSTHVLRNAFLSLFLSDSICNYSNPAIQIISNSKLKNPISADRKGKKILVFCNSQITKNGRNGNLKEAESIFNRMPFRDVVSWTALLTAYSENEEITKARELFDKMPEKSTATWNAMITAYVRKMMIREAFELFWMIPSRSSVSYGTMITGFLRAGMLKEAEKLYLEVPMIGRDPVASNSLIAGYLKNYRLDDAVRVFEGMSMRDVVSWSSILNGYCKQGRISDAREVFEKMPERNVVSWTSMLGGYLDRGMWEDGLNLFSRMRKEGIGINSTTVTVILDACADDLGRLWEGIQIHGLAFSMGFEWDVFLGNSMIAMYSRTGWMDAANRVFDVMKKKDLVSWNSLIAGYVQNDGIEEAFTLFLNMPEKDVVSWTSMVVGFSNRGRMEESIHLFEEIPGKDDVAWTAIISGFVANAEYENAFRWFVAMVQGGIRPNSLTLSSILSASGSLAALNEGMQLHTHVIKMKLESDVSVQNSLVSMYAKCGNVYDAYRVFLRIDEPNLVSVNSMITGYAQHGCGKEALDLFKEMQVRGFKPNQITFLGLLSACVHAGLVEEGWYYFKVMGSSYSVEPGPDHYACVVDLLGRAGLLKEATDLINSMPFEAHSAIWGALLSASRKHMDLDFAKLAAQHLFELEPDNTAYYAVLSNMYSLTGLKKDEEKLRMDKTSKGMKKTPGCSWITVSKKVHLFLAGDQSHIEFNEIHAALRRFAAHMEKLGC